MAKPELPPWRKYDDVEWTYERSQGDIVVYARTRYEALATIRQHGFILPNPELLKQTSGRYDATSTLKRDEIK